MAESIRLFEANDGRVGASDILFVRPGYGYKLFSNGWDCDRDDEEIVVYTFIDYPENQCEEGLIDVWLEECKIDCCTSIELPKVRLTKNLRHAIIDEVGQYIVHRKCGAETVNVYAKKIKLN